MINAQVRRHSIFQGNFLENTDMPVYLVLKDLTFYILQGKVTTIHLVYLVYLANDYNLVNWSVSLENCEKCSLS